MDPNIKNSNFPDPFASFEEKLTTEYGVKLAKLISADWFNVNGFAGHGTEYYNRRQYVREKRLFVGNTVLTNLKKRTTRVKALLS
jgi:hypothetical protein